MQRLLPIISTQLVYTGVFVLLLFVLFFRTHRVFPKNDLFDDWSSTGQIIILQYPSMLDEKNNRLTQR